MHEKFDRKEVLLWCYESSTGSKGDAPTEKGKVPSGSRYDSHTKKMAEVDDIVKKLKEKHPANFPPEQLRTWAHMIHMRNHTSNEHPPDKPFFRGTKRRLPEDAQSSTPKKNCPAGNTAAAMSPARRVTVQSELLDQLQKWHDLREMGAISAEEHVEFQKTILSDLKKL